MVNKKITLTASFTFAVKEDVPRKNKKTAHDVPYRKRQPKAEKTQEAINQITNVVISK